jgi:uracil-DNA glycosylase
MLDGPVLLGSFHPSQQNTFTGKLTRPMLRRVFAAAKRLAGTPSP